MVLNFSFSGVTCWFKGSLFVVISFQMGGVDVYIFIAYI